MQFVQTDAAESARAPNGQQAFYAKYMAHKGMLDGLSVHQSASH